MTADLPARLEAGPGSRELSDEVMLALGWARSDKQETVLSVTQWVRGWLLPNNGGFRDAALAPDPSRSVDDGLALAGDDWHAILAQALKQYRTTVGLPWEMPLKRLPLFICAALVRARAKQQEDSSDG